MAEITLNAGDLRHQVTINQNTPTLDARTNQPEPNWAFYLSRWAKIETTAGSDYIAAQQIRNGASHVVTMRYCPGLDARDYQVVFFGRTFNILSVVNVEERNIITMLGCKEVE